MFIFIIQLPNKSLSTIDYSILLNKMRKTPIFLHFVEHKFSMHIILIL